MPEVITKEMEEIRLMIMQTVAARNALKAQMQAWYETHAHERFGDAHKLITTDATLQELDAHYKRLWDYYNKKQTA